ncbi:MAG: sulfatase-like hydrolase/transferase [Chloroflexi bacterium]|nr:sulfatase-like hydrolase/transferase [Chloroflexota bacterium]
MEPKNLLFIISDQHQAAAMGCAGHRIVRTPNLDRLAAGGTRFRNAYTNCAICVPARASLATGRYVHQIGNWDNGLPYDGSVPSWGHRLKAEGFRVDSIGKLHFRSAEDDNGFTQEIEPLHVVEGIGDPASGIRDGSLRRNYRVGIDEAGPGDSTYQQYDIRNRDNAIRWLHERANDEKPWVLFLSFVTPHPPFLAPPETYQLYRHEDIALPPQWDEANWPRHPAYEYMRRFFSHDQPFDEAAIRRLHAAYYGICTFLDDQIGQVLAALDSLSLGDKTRVIYTSDHGEHLGARGIFGKFTMYEEASAIPFVLSGPDVPAGVVLDTPISLVDCYPTVLDAVGCRAADDVEELPGESIWDIAAGTDRDRTIFAEYHAIASNNAHYMLRDRRYKYIYHVGAPPQLFDLIADPCEAHDLAANPNKRSQTLLANFATQLRAILDPEAVDRQAKADQLQRIESLGGREAVVARGAFINSPAPGEKPQFRKLQLVD